MPGSPSEHATAGRSVPPRTRSSRDLASRKLRSGTTIPDSGDTLQTLVAAPATSGPRRDREDGKWPHEASGALQHGSEHLDDRHWRSVAASTEDTDMIDKTGPDDEAAANRRARSLSNLASTSSEARGRRASSAHANPTLGLSRPAISFVNGLAAPGQPAAEQQGHSEGPHPTDIDAPALPKLRVHPASAPPVRVATTSNTDIGPAEAGSPTDSTAAGAAVGAKPRLTRSAAHVDPAQKGAKAGDAAAPDSGQPGSPPAGPVRVLPQRQGLHTPRGSTAVSPLGQKPTGASQAPGEDGLPPGPGGPSSPRARSSSGPHSPRSPRVVTSATDRKTRADAEAAKAAADLEAQAREQEHKEEILQRAADIRAARDAAARPLPAAAEPKRTKTHRDFLLEEMAWLAKEFQKERSWKMKQAKKYVRAVVRSNMDVESRAVVRQREAELAIRRRAAWIGKEVMQFWKKAERVVAYKQQSVVDARKKEAMDKHLSFLVGQTQKYSSLLAQRLAANDQDLPALLSPPPSRPIPASNAAAPPAPAPALLEGPSASDRKPDAAAAKLAAAAGNGARPAAPGLQGQLGAPERSKAAETSSAALAEPLADGSGAGEEDEEEFQVETGMEDDDDDEATLEEEEALAREAGEGEDEEGELSMLNDEADMPLEQLLARYGFVTGNDAAEAAEDTPPAAGVGSAGGGDVKMAESSRGMGIAAPSVKSEEHTSEAESGSEHDHSSADEGPPSKRRRTDEGVRDLAKIMTGQESEAAGDGDYASEGSGDDDEATLEEEDAMAAQDGADRAAEEAAEAAALADEADMPLEQLLARYGYVMGNDADEDSNGPSDMDVDGGKADQPAQASSKEPSDTAGAKATAPPGATAVTDADEPMPSAFPSTLAVPPESQTTAAAPSEGIPVSAAPEEAAGPSAPSLAAKEDASESAAAGPSAPNLAAREQARGNAAEDATGDEALTELEREAQGAERLEGVARLASQVQPKGHTLDSAGVHIQVPFLLKGSLREYQHVGLEWLITIYTRRLNGILADEMGLGKTIMTISLLAHLACEKGVWGPHLIVVPTSVMLNWEVECKKWCPAFKLLTYYGSAKERKAKRQGWSKPNAFHICITSYTLVLQDAKMFRRKKWKYLILDEAHMIKNWKSQRWQTLLNFNSQRRLLITGTPLQNDLMELWSLMHFLMPQVFASHAQFKDWFSNPLTGMVEGQEAVNKALVERLHGVLRPFLLRRLKSEVEKQLPGKHEHVVRCRLSKRQRTLYEDYMASSDTASTLTSGNFLGIINVLMQLRKVCNHPDLFEGRPIVSAFDMVGGLSAQLPSAVVRASEGSVWDHIDLGELNLLPIQHEAMSQWEAQEVQVLQTPKQLIEELNASKAEQRGDQSGLSISFVATLEGAPSQGLVHAVAASLRDLRRRRAEAAAQRRALMAAVNERRSRQAPLFGRDLVEAVRVELPVHQVHVIKQQRGRHLDFADAVADAVQTCQMRAEQLDDELKTFMFVIPRARAPPPEIWCSRPDPSAVAEAAARAAALQAEVFARSAPLRTAIVRQQLFFPDRRLIQFDCGKLQELAELLRRLKSGDHRALIFTQMARMLDILEVFLNLHGYSYLRLDGTTKPEQRQILMQRFNTNPKLFVFILSTRSGGVGMNLTGADTVIFYDSDWNPAMDAQAQDRCHRIGQTREVHIYRLVSERTIEENILTKSDQKRQLDHLAIQSGGFNTDFLQKFNPREILGLQGAPTAAAGPTSGGMSEEEVQAALRSVEDEGDRAAAAALERETADELAEFSAEPAPALAPDADAEADEDAEDGDDTRGAAASGAEDGAVAAASGAASQPSSELPLVKAEEVDADDDAIMSDVAALAHGGQSADPVANLESALRPIERYAVRFLEEVAPSRLDVEAAAAAVEAELDAQEWNMQEIERIQEEQEAEIEEDAEATRAVDWDKAAADAAYRAQVERAQERQRILQEQLAREEAAAAAAAEAAALAYEARVAETGAASRSGGAVGKKGYKKARITATRSMDPEEAESALPSPRPTFSRKRARTARGRVVVRPKWPGEDDTGGSSPDPSEAYSSADEASHAGWGGYGEGQKRVRYEQQQPSPAPLPGIKVEGGGNGRPRSRFSEAPPARLGFPQHFQRPPTGAAMPQPGPYRGTPVAAPVSPQPHTPRPYNTARKYATVGQLRPPQHTWIPWDVSEDVVLAAMVEEAVQEGVSRGNGNGAQSQQLGRAVWELISTTLAAGAAALTVNAAAAARQASKFRSPEQCWERYQMLLAALQGSRAAGMFVPAPAAVPQIRPTPVSPLVPQPAPAYSTPLIPASAPQQLAPLAGPIPQSSAPSSALANGLSISSPAMSLGQPQMQAQPAAQLPVASAASPVMASSSPAVPGGQQGAQASDSAAGSATPPPRDVGSAQPLANAETGPRPSAPAREQPATAGPVQTGSSAACLESLTQQLVWLSRRNPACSTAGLQSVLAAAYIESPPTNGTAAAAQELTRDLQGLLAAADAPVNGAAKPAVPFTAARGAPRQQPMLLSVGAAEAATVKEAVRRAAGPCSRGILRHLASVVTAVRTGGIKAGNAALTQLLQLPKAPQPQQPLPASQQPPTQSPRPVASPQLQPFAGAPRMQPPQQMRPPGPKGGPFLHGAPPPATQGMYPGHPRPLHPSMGHTGRPLQRPVMGHVRLQQPVPSAQLRPPGVQRPFQQQAAPRGPPMRPAPSAAAGAQPGQAPQFAGGQMPSALVAQLQQIAAVQLPPQAGVQQAAPGMQPLGVNMDALQRMAAMQPAVPGQVPPALALLHSLLAARAGAGFHPGAQGVPFLPAQPGLSQPPALAVAMRAGMSSQPLPAPVGPIGAPFAAPRPQHAPVSQLASAAEQPPQMQQQQQSQPGAAADAQRQNPPGPQKPSQ